MKLFNRYKFLFLFFSVLVGINNCYSQNNGVLWRITSPDLKDTSFMFGTNHSVRVSFPVPFEVKRAISKAELTIVESKITGLSVLCNFRSFTKMIFNPRWSKIDRFIDKDKSDSLKKYCIARFKVKEDNYVFYSRFRPLIMYSFLKGEKKYTIATYSVDDSVEIYSNVNRNKIKTLENIRQISKYEQSLPVKYEFELTFPDLVFDSLKLNNSIYDEQYLAGGLDDFLGKNTQLMNHSEKMVLHH